ncbi:MAG TPA: glycosyltransferase family 2 protein [Thermoanaerobaculia bacterium]|nr:glycosyltransferase family 2 protein [Thermoanaerobaculia bacterium]
MSTVSIPATASLLLGAGLLGLALRTAWQRRHAPALPAPPRAAPSGDSPAVTLLLPVRDEEANVLPCLDTLLAQSDRPEVRVVDDGSTDATAELAARRAQSEPRLRLMPAGPLPPGWRGKVHALHAGAQGVATPWIATSDADTRHHPELLARARAAAEAGGLDLLSVAGTQEARGLGENLLIPAVFALLDTLLGDWRAAAAGTSPPVANGQFLLLRRESWERCGGFESVRGEALDDVAIAKRLRSQGFRTAFFRTPGLLRVRMYRGAAEALSGWRRNLGGLFGDNPGLLAAVTAVCGVPAVFLLGCLIAGPWPAALLLWGLGAAASVLLRATGGNAPLYGLLYPLDALLLAGVLLLGARDRRRGRLMNWKGREMKV